MERAGRDGLCKQGNLQCPSSQTLEANEKVSSPVADTKAFVVQAGIFERIGQKPQVRSSIFYT